MNISESKKLLEDMYEALNAQDLEAHHNIGMTIWFGMDLQVLETFMV